MTKITYEFDSVEDDGDVQIHQNAVHMFRALCNLRSYTRELYKGWKEFKEDEIIDRLNDIIYESKIDEVP